MVSLLEGRSAIVLGATSGIGRQIAARFVEEGADVSLAGRSPDRGDLLAKELGVRANFVKTDVTVASDINRLVRAAIEWRGKIDCLVNCAGSASETAGLEELSEERMMREFRLHVGGVLLASKSVLPYLKLSSCGSIVSISSASGLAGGHAGVVYSSAKAAVIHATRCLAIDLAPWGIRVNCVSPGIVATPLFTALRGVENCSIAQAKDAVRRWGRRHVPLGRAGEPADIASAVVFLASDQASFITGHNLVVDGGSTVGPHPRDATSLHEELLEALSTSS